MFLKSLEIRGFKSFADKTQLKFRKGVTAVVGPNGSGKSNISDSVRWVLGEQSVKTLRGGKMEDVIFAGTQFRKAVGLAQVSITLDNSDNSLDTDYSEVTITRRIFRSGETEYLINNQKCRLKDINNLFMDTGIGKEGYSLIGQGKIEAILSGKPEERRNLLEEAAGIVKFKSRKEEAEKKLDNTEGNLVRIRDIISTYEERIEPLKIEREKALKYKEISDELKVKEVSILVNNINRIDNDVKEVENDITKRQNEISNRKEKLKLEKEELLKLENSIEELEKKNEKEKREYYIKKEESNQNANDIEIFKERIKNLQEILVKDKAEIDDIKVMVKASKEEKILLGKELHEKIKKQVEQEELLRGLEEEIKSLNKEIIKLENELSNLKEGEFELLRKTSELNNNVVVLKKDLSNKEEISITGESRIKTLEGNISINVATILELTKKIEKAKEERDVIKEYILENKKKITNLNLEVTKKEHLIKEITRNINTLDGKKTTLKDLEKNYEGYQMSVKRIMERIDKGLIPNCNGTKVLGEVFTVDKKYETAIEIALSGGISNIITNDEKIAKNLIEYLKNNSLGRATFLPLNIIKGNRISVGNEITSIDGYLGIASDLIKYDNKYKEIMDYSLGKTIIARNMDSAIKISKAGRHKLRIVTIDGEIISPGGALTGGSIYKKNNSSILGRRRELEEIEILIDKNKNEYNNEIEALEKLKKKVKEIDENNLNKTDEIHGKNIDITKYESEIIALENEKQKLVNSFEYSKKELIFNKENLEKVKAEILKKEEALNNIKEESFNNKNRIETLEKIIKDKKIKFESQKETVIEIKIKKATLDEIVQGKQSEIKRKEREEIEKEDKLNLLNKESKVKEENIESLKLEIENKIEKIKEITDVINNLEEGFKSDEIEKITLKESFKKRENFINEIIDIIRNEENELNKKEILNAKIQSEVESYYKRLNEELNLTLAEAQEIAIEIDSVSKIKDEIFHLKSKISALGTVNLAAIMEYEEVCEKYEFMSAQEEDLNKAKEELLRVIGEMTSNMQELFRSNFEILNANFNETFKELFKGGNAELILSDGDELTANIDINVQPPGKKLQNINLMSGGEKVLSAIALLFAILKMKPTPFCILDEIEAALDDANVHRYAEFLKEFSEKIQFIVITHRKGTMEASDVMYGITMEEKGISKVVSVDLSENS